MGAGAFGAPVFASTRSLWNTSDMGISAPFESKVKSENKKEAGVLLSVR